ncbi:hypothetical protein BC830DRAFT_1086788 [Chytriomyces sp. MP71]|nr:hypothetical protein BC830DRAFT_1086788 [Chytriomyces sp. MP71]
MIQAVPPQLQKIVTIQQRVGRTKFHYVTPPPSAGKAFSPSSLNNDEVVYVSVEKETKAVFSGSGEGAASMEAEVIANHHPLRKAVSETLQSTRHHQYLNKKHWSHGTESLGHFPTTMGQPGSGANYEGSHVPYEVLANMNYEYSAGVDPTLLNQQQHPLMGEEGERKGSFASRAPSLPGLAKWDQFGNHLSTAIPRSDAPPAASFVQHRRSSSNQVEYSPGIEPNEGGPVPYAMPMMGTKGMHRRGSRTVTSHRHKNILFQMEIRMHHRLEMHVTHFLEPLSHNSLDHILHPMSLSMQGQFTLNQPWNQPIQHQTTLSTYQQTVCQGGSGAGGSSDLKKLRVPPKYIYRFSIKSATLTTCLPPTAVLCPKYAKLASTLFCWSTFRVCNRSGGTGLGLDFSKANIPNSPKSAQLSLGAQCGLATYPLR